MRHAVLLIGLVVAACTSSEPSEAKSPPPPRPLDVATAPPLDDEKRVEAPAEPEPATLPPVEGFFMAEGAPQPRACTAKPDCLGDTIPDLAQPCCNDPRSLEPYAWAYRTWVNGWRRDHCSEVECPPPPAPAMPPACAFEVDCVERRCVDSCE
jgi:hypothetical protein